MARVRIRCTVNIAMGSKKDFTCSKYFVMYSYKILRNQAGISTITIVHFKRLGSRHFLKEMKIESILLKFNMIFRKTNLKPLVKYIQKVLNHPNYQI